MLHTSRQRHTKHADTPVEDIMIRRFRTYRNASQNFPAFIVMPSVLTQLECSKQNYNWEHLCSMNWIRYGRTYSTNANPWIHILTQFSWATTWCTEFIINSCYTVTIKCIALEMNENSERRSRKFSNQRTVKYEQQFVLIRLH